MPDTQVQFNTRLTPEQLAETKRSANRINQKHKAEGKNYGENLGKDAFLKLLVTELTHQDPTNPMEDRQFIAQMAQFSSLEQMNNMNEQMIQMNNRNSASEAYSLIGKEVESLDAKSGHPIRGTVTHVIRGRDGLYLGVDNQQVRLEDVHAVYPPKASDTEKATSQQRTQENSTESNYGTVFTPETGHHGTHIQTTDHQRDIDDQQSTTKGMKNSFNHLDSFYDNSNSRHERARSSYMEQQ